MPPFDARDLSITPWRSDPFLLSAPRTSPCTSGGTDLRGEGLSLSVRTLSGIPGAAPLDPFFSLGYLSCGAPPSPSPPCTAPGNDDGIAPVGEGLGTRSCTRSGTALTSLEDPPFWPGYPSDGAPPSPSPLCTVLGNDDGIAPVGEGLGTLFCTRSGTALTSLADPPFWPGYPSGGAPPSPSPLCTALGNDDGIAPVGEGLGTRSCTRSGTAQASPEDPLF